MTYWQDWHARYQDPNSHLSQRLGVVQGRIRHALDHAPAGPIRVISICAGDGRDLLGVLADHPRRHDVMARLVELDPILADRARQAATDSGLTAIDVVTGNAAVLSRYTDHTPADLVLSCGIFGNISDRDIEATIAAHRSLCAHGGTVIWTRHRREPDLVPQICEWFADHGFHREFVSDVNLGYGVGVHRYAGQPQPLATGGPIFAFA